MRFVSSDEAATWASSFAPTGSSERYPESQPAGWHGIQIEFENQPGIGIIGLLGNLWLRSGRGALACCGSRLSACGLPARICISITGSDIHTVRRVILLNVGRLSL